MKDDFELDFSGVSAGTAKKQPETPKVEEATKTEATPAPAATKPTGIVIFTENGHKDLAEASGEEFLIWAEGAWPILNKDKCDPKDFETTVQKRRAFEQIMNWHANLSFTNKHEKDLKH